MRGKYIVLEGGEGSGKDEQLSRLVKYLESQKIDVVATREPGTTEFSESVRKSMLTSFDTSPQTQLLLVNAARSDTIEYISEVLDEGKWVVCTRNWLSSVALQGNGLGLSTDDVLNVCSFATHGVEPDLTIILDVDVEVAEKRRRSRGGPDDNYQHRYEEEDLHFHRRVNQGYRDAAARFDYNLVDANRTKEQVESDLKELVSKLMTDNSKQNQRLSKPVQSGVYSNKQIKQAIKDNHIVFHPFNEKHIAGSSVDVTLGEWFYRTEKSHKARYYNPFDQNDVDRYFEAPLKATPHAEWAKRNQKPLFKGIPKNHPIIVLGPGERILAHTHEFIGIKPPGTSTMQARSSWGRNGVAVCLDAGWGDPGYINRWTMEIYNMNQHESVVLPIGERIAQVVFYSTGEVESDYSSITGKYQTTQGYDLSDLVKNWKPESMLPQSYKDRREQPKSLQINHGQATTQSDNIEDTQALTTKQPNGSKIVTEAGKNVLQDAITDVDGNVYAFTNKLPNPTIAAAMARLSRRSDDMRVTLLDEFVGKKGQDSNLLNRVITAYGDDSVQQLAGIHIVVENASNLLTKRLEWGRLAAYLEQSTRYIYFDKKDTSDNYRYYTPPNLDAKTARKYEATMDEIFDTYSKMVHKLTEYVRNSAETPKAERDGAWKGATRAQACDAIRNTLPVATKSTVGIFASAQAAESLYMHLMSDELLESRDAGEAILKQLREVMPVFYERADKPDRGGATIAYRANTRMDMQELVANKLPQNLSEPSDDVTLTDYWPKNELDLLPHMMFEYSTLPLDAIEKEIQAWSYDERVKSFRTYVGERLNRRHRPGRAIENAHYTWELMCDYGIFRDLQRHRMVDDLNWQELTPRYGYDVPELVEKAGLTELFEHCFDLSYQLYSLMQREGYEVEAQYATLLGHKMRWKITYNAREAFHFHELRTAPQGHPGYRKLVKKMHDTMSGVHPILADSMIFVNKDEDPQLTRLAAEKYTQYKLKQLDIKRKSND